MRVAIIISAVLVLVLLDYVNPSQLWLCGLVGCSVATVYELCPLLVSYQKLVAQEECFPQNCTNSAR
jgi:uncharacterized membrane protein YjjB (DUF3815 family)